MHEDELAGSEGSCLGRGSVGCRCRDGRIWVMRTVSLIIVIGSIVTAAGLPLLFLFRHPGQKMDDKPYRRWIISTSVAVVIGLVALIVYGLTA